MRLFYFITIFIIGLDQLTKGMIVTKMNENDIIPVIDNFFYIHSHRNRGAAWGILQDQMVFFYIITAIVVVGIIYFYHKEFKGQLGFTVALSFILGGAIGNFIDRLFRKEVVDFLDFNIFGYDYPIFNLADSFLVIGVGLFILFTILDERKQKKVN